jgi:Uma2 family endonuclease
MNAALHLPVKTLPVSLVSPTFLSDDDFEALCFANDWFRLERTKEGEVVVHAPAGGFTSKGNSEINRQLGNWWVGHRRGMLFDSNCGFFLPDGSMLGPDAAYVTAERMRGLRKEDLVKLPRFCPDFVVELLSPSDRLSATKAKMERWIENGASLGWLIDPRKKRVFVHRPGAGPVVVSGNAVQGSGPIDGFTLDLAEVWRCYEL